MPRLFRIRLLPLKIVDGGPDDIPFGLVRTYHIHLCAQLRSCARLVNLRYDSYYIPGCKGYNIGAVKGIILQSAHKQAHKQDFLHIRHLPFVRLL